MTEFTDAVFYYFRSQYMAFGLFVLFLGAAVFYLRQLSNPDNITTRRNLIGKTVVATTVSICSAVTCVGLAFYSRFYGENGLFTTLDIIAGAFVLLVSLVVAYKLITAVRSVRWSQIFAALAICFSVAPRNPCSRNTSRAARSSSVRRWESTAGASLSTID